MFLIDSSATTADFCDSDVVPLAAAMHWKLPREEHF
jgi:hypothetical protein